MITTEEAEIIGFDKQPHSTVYRLVIDDFAVWIQNDKVTLSEWHRDEDIDISHLDIEQLKMLISLLTKPKNE